MQDEQSRLCTDDILSQTDIILPSQYFESVGSERLCGEQRLMLAVLVDAINILQSWRGIGSPRKRRNFAEAAQWVNACGTRHPFSFDSVCHALDIDSALLRSRLRTFTVRPTNSARPGLGRLQLKELSRSQHMTANRLRRRERVRRDMNPNAELASVPSPRWYGQTESEQDRTEEPSGSEVPFDSLFTETAIGESVSW